MPLQAHLAADKTGRSGGFAAVIHSQLGMTVRLRLEYWKDETWFVGRLADVPGVFSQGETLEELEENVCDAYRMMMEGQQTIPQSQPVSSKEISITA
jgi:predicted RNase H-like HicB family nuclease